MDICLRYFERLTKKIERRHVICFLSGLIIGMITHLYMITNKITNWDDQLCPRGVGGGEYLGRWLLRHANEWFAPWSVPAVNGTMAVVLLAAAACFILSVLEIRSTLGSILLPAVFVTFPAVTSNMTFMYIAASFSVAVLLCVIAVYLVRRTKWGWIAGVFLLMDGMAIYQAYFAIAAALLVLCLILDVLRLEPAPDAKETARRARKDAELAIIKRGVFYVVFLGISMAAYLISLKVAGYEITDYKGMDSIGETSAGQLVYAILRALHRPIQYFVTRPANYLAGSLTKWNRIGTVVFLVILIDLFLVRKLFKSALSILLWVGLWGFFLLALGLVYVMAPTIDHASTVMTFSFVCFYFAMLAVTERLGEGISGSFWQGVLPGVLTFLVALTLALTSYHQYRLANDAYYRSQVAELRVRQFLNRVMTKVEEAPGYDYGEPLLILGNYYPEKPPIMYRDMDSVRYSDLEGLAMEDGLLSQGVRPNYLRNVIGINPVIYSVEQAEEMMQRPEYLEMPIFPADGCVKVIDGIYVVRIAE